MLTIFRRTASLGILVAACQPSAEADLGVCLDEVLAEPFPTGPTPPLPADPCAAPPSATSIIVENTARAAQEQAAADAARWLDPGRITVITCGTGSPLPSDRAQACTAVFAGGQFLLFDAGDGAQQSMESLGLPVTQLTTMFLTHYHSDHIADVGEVMSRSWILGRSEPLTIHGGNGIARVVEGFNLVYTPDDAYRTAHHGEEILPPSIQAATPSVITDVPIDGKVVYDVGGVVVRAYPMDHSPVDPALGYSVAYGGRTVGITGDTIDTPGLRALAEGVDILVSEVLDKETALASACGVERAGDERNSKILRDIRTYHIGTDELAEVAVAAGVGTLVLTHMFPSVTPVQAGVLFVQPIAQRFGGEIVAAEDGTELVIDLD